MNHSSSFNGSVQLLADALQQVVSEAVRDGVAPVRQDMQTLRQDVQTLRQHMQAMEDRLNDRIDVTNQNMQAQFAEQETKIARLIRGRAN
ncbi:MAG: hypothetical protein OXG29_13195 [Gammaproteobacteria bacterium]|nr:hypothetical protein [Gammaproteobacteria bacterium]